MEFDKTGIKCPFNLYNSYNKYSQKYYFSEHYFLLNYLRLTTLNTRKDLFNFYSFSHNFHKNHLSTYVLSLTFLELIKIDYNISKHEKKSSQ